ncbi:CcoQ/FixQ family Cbb3-type cytochrome c oxidase assembly chaperone [uncultured Sphingomonas sp.]|uniref:CcoQ/FixQ family Cbb3-type cytochrome c oxidase assembly chaperone n=1 Tax=uncultured Sphingomonas sp. TaxID=158754 RepID=UPI0026309B64|nr:CcoQ/FixQ family Cbb3-type cytochrome c oxidase assembly chaperone [uncultured Sphingomonas sp.]
MSTYDTMRHLADGYGLVVMVGVFAVLIGWAFLPRNRAANRRAANSIFDEAENG